ncbi:MAG: RNA polymerase sigma factor [Myxococcales bacterium]|nr:RNA polymerase sigma factor [Myxococcales bacterium]
MSAAQSSTAAAPETFGHLVAPELTGLRGQALRLTRCPAAADDLVQEALLRAFRHRGRFSVAPGADPQRSMGAWLRRILLNTFSSGYRRQRREREVLESAWQQAALGPAHQEPAAAEPAELSEPLALSVAALRPEYRAVLWAVAVDDLSYRETAQALHCPVGTVMSRLHRARSSLRRSLARAGAAAGVAGTAVTLDAA